MFKMKIKFLLLAFAAIQATACVSSENLKSKTLHIGFNGLDVFNKRQYFVDAKSLENSWLKKALTPNDLSNLVSQVNFENQFVMVYSFGQRVNFTGEINLDYIKNMNKDTHNYKVIDIDTNVSIAGLDANRCNSVSNTYSYPFFVELVDRPANTKGFEISNGSYAAFNFPAEGCPTPKSGQPTLE